MAPGPRDSGDLGADSEGAGEELASRIRRHGPLPYEEVIEVALYHPTLGFYSQGGAAGRRRGDFITSPEVGPLFGAVLGRALDAWWRELGEPDPFVVVDCGAGLGTLAKIVSAAEPACLGALAYVLVERSEALRAHHGDNLSLTLPQMAFAPRASAGEGDGVAVTGTGPRFVSLSTPPALSLTGVVLANELLDNLPFRIVERVSGAWTEVRVGLGADDRTLAETRVPAPDELAELAERLVPDARDGARVPIETGAAEWLRSALGHVDRGRVVVIDYAATTAELAVRPPRDWLRTYREHGRGGEPLENLGAQDLTVDVCVDQLSRVRPPDLDRSQVEFLYEHGLRELVDEGKQMWHERAHIGDLEAIRGRSRVSEAEALTEVSGLGSFRVLEWCVG